MLLSSPSAHRRSSFGAASAPFFEMKSKVSGTKLSPGSAGYNAVRAEVEDIIGDSISRLTGSSWVFYGLGGYIYGLSSDGNLFIVGTKNSHTRGDYRLDKARVPSVKTATEQLPSSPSSSGPKDKLTKEESLKAASNLGEIGSAVKWVAIASAGLIGLGALALILRRK
jgi:hypothetical protein